MHLGWTGCFNWSTVPFKLRKMWFYKYGHSFKKRNKKGYIITYKLSPKSFHTILCYGRWPISSSKPVSDWFSNFWKYLGFNRYWTTSEVLFCLLYLDSILPTPLFKNFIKEDIIGLKLIIMGVPNVLENLGWGGFTSHLYGISGII